MDHSMGPQVCVSSSTCSPYSIKAYYRQLCISVSERGVSHDEVYAEESRDTYDYEHLTIARSAILEFSRQCHTVYIDRRSLVGTQKANLAF